MGKSEHKDAQLKRMRGYATMCGKIKKARKQGSTKKFANKPINRHSEQTCILTPRKKLRSYDRRSEDVGYAAQAGAQESFKDEEEV